MTKKFNCLKCGELVEQTPPTHLFQERPTACQCGQVHHVKTVVSLSIRNSGAQNIVDWTIVNVCALAAV